jgi:tripartite ATP-independent transporter DctM subunit
MTTLGLMGLTILLLLAAGWPIALVLGATGLFWIILFDARQLSGVAHTLFNTAASEALIAVPLFVLMGQIVQHARVSERFYRSVSGWLRRLPGGLLHANIAVCSVFSAVSGSSVATAATVGTAALPSLQRLRYDPKLAAGSLAAGGTLGILIPPSIPLIVYGSIVQESIGKLFIAALVPALILVIMFHIYIVLRCLANPALAPADDVERNEGGNLRGFLTDILPVISIVVAVLGGIYSGITTSTEAAAVGALMALIVAGASGNVTRSMLRTVMTETATLTAMMLFIVIGAQIFSYAVFTWGINAEIGRIVSDLALPRGAVLAVIIGIYIILGMFLDALSLMLMTLAIVHPIIVALGYDPLWFGILLVLLLEIGLITPPVGMNLFTIKAVSQDIKLSDVGWGALPFAVLMLIAIVILSVFPGLVLWLPLR